MTYTPIPAGTEHWDVPVNEAFADQDARITDNAGLIAANTAAINTNAANVAEINDFTPADYGLITWTYDPSTASSQLAIVAGVINMAKVKIRKTATISNLGIGISTAGTMSAGNYLGLYDSSGTRLAQTADQVGSWGTTGWRVGALTAPVQVVPGDYYVAILSNFTVAPQLVRGANLAAAPEGQLLNLGLSNATARFTTVGSGLTALPATIDMSTRAPNRTAWWVTVS